MNGLRVQRARHHAGQHEDHQQPVLDLAVRQEGQGAARPQQAGGQRERDVSPQQRADLHGPVPAPRGVAPQRQAQHRVQAQQRQPGVQPAGRHDVQQHAGLRGRHQQASEHDERRVALQRRQLVEPDAAGMHVVRHGAWRQRVPASGAFSPRPPASACRSIPRPDSGAPDCRSARPRRRACAASPRRACRAGWRISRGRGSRPPCPRTGWR